MNVCYRCGNTYDSDLPMNSKKLSTFIFEKNIETETQEYQTCKYQLYEPCPLKKYKLGKKMGEGSYGTVYESTIYIVKIMPLEHEDYDLCGMTKIKDFEKEVKLTSYMSEMKLGPTFIESMNCEALATNKKGETKDIPIGIIVQEKWDLSLEDYIHEFPELFTLHKKQIKSLVKGIIEDYLDVDITHMDAKPQNTVVKLCKHNVVKEVTFIDFGSIILEDSRTRIIREKQMWKLFRAFKVF
jgi:serine/threonine protein kinase